MGLCYAGVNNDITSPPPIHKLCFRYDPRLNQWSSLCPMNTRRLGVGLAVCGACIYCIGGSDGSTPLSSVERYYNSSSVYHCISPSHSS